MTLCPSLEADLSAEFSRGFAASDLRPLHEWLPDNVTLKEGFPSPFPGKLAFHQTPWLIMPLTAARRATCHRQTLQAASAGGKSTVGEAHLAWSIANAPGFSCWFTPTEITTKEFAETRIWPFLESCPQVVKLLPQDRHKRRTESIIFPHMAFLMLPANISSTQSKHIRYLYCDETWLYEPGLLAQMHKRTDAFAHNRKIFEFSTGSILGDETDQAWNAGTRREWQLKCPKCSTWHTPFFSPERLDMPGGVRWAPEAKLHTGVYDFSIIRESCYYECLCRERFKPTQANAYILNRDGKYTGPDEIQRHESFHWSAIVCHFPILGEIAVEFVQAKAAIRRGSTALLQEFTQKREARPWNISVIDDEPPMLIEPRYSIGDPWPEAESGFLYADVQKDCLWAMIRDWMTGPRTRLVFAGKVLTWDELRALQIQYGIADECVWIDSGYSADVVYGQCCRFGWTATKGEKAPGGFIVKDETEERSYRVPVVKANGNGVPLRLPADAKFMDCELYRISEEMTAESLHLFRTGRADGWEEPKNPPEDYTAQMAARVWRTRQDKRTGQTIRELITIGTCGEHLHDCARGQLAMAFKARFLEGNPVIEKESESKPTN